MSACENLIKKCNTRTTSNGAIFLIFPNQYINLKAIIYSINTLYIRWYDISKRKRY